MSFESIYRTSYGLKEINKICDFMMALVIKNNYEARSFETEESLLNYYKYHGAYTKTDDFEDYDYSDRENYKEYALTYVNKYYSGLITDTILSDLAKKTTEELNQRIISDRLVKTYLSGLRIGRLGTYDEKNLYYRRFLGIPGDKSEIVYVQNKDAGEDGFTLATETNPIPGVEYFSKKIVYGKVNWIKLGVLKEWVKENNVVIDHYKSINIEVHKISDSRLFPKSHTFYITQNNIKTIIKLYPKLVYLRFVGVGYKPFYLRSLPNYSILLYDKFLLSNNELYYFFKAYEKAKKQVLMDYVDGFDKRQPLYNLMMIEQLLHLTMINYSNTYIEKYSLGIYSDKQVDDLLISHGYRKLTNLKNNEIKRKTLKNIDDLVSNKGNNYILDIILKRLLNTDDARVSLKRYYLEKRYYTDSNNSTDGKIHIDTSKGLEKSVNLVFKEIDYNFNETEKYSSNAVYKDYDKFVQSDDLWGGVTQYDKETIIKDKTTLAEQKKNFLKNKLLSIPFNSILTKHIVIQQSINILENQRRLSDALFMMLKNFDEFDVNIFFRSKIIFKDIEITPAAIFAGICWLQQMKYYKMVDADIIMTDNCLINSAVVFRKAGRFDTDLDFFKKNVYIVDGKPVEIDPNCEEINLIEKTVFSCNLIEFMLRNKKWFPELKLEAIDKDHIPTVKLDDILKLGDSNGKIDADGFKRMFLTDADISDYLTRFRYYFNGQPLDNVTSETKFNDILSDYDNQYRTIINRITEKLRESSDFREYQAWMYMLEQNRTDQSIYFIFKNCVKFSEFIKLVNSTDLISYFNENITMYDIPETDEESKNKKREQLESICKIQNELKNAFRNWVSKRYSDTLYGEETDEKEGADHNFVHDIRLLFDEFLSVYSELYDTDFNYSFGDKEHDGLSIQMFYSELKQHHNSKYNDDLDLHYSQSFTEKINGKNKDSVYNTDLEDSNLSIDYKYRYKEKANYSDAINNKLHIENNNIVVDDPFDYEHSTLFKTEYFDKIELDYIQSSHEKVSYEDEVGSFEGVLKITTDEGENFFYD